MIEITEAQKKNGMDKVIIKDELLKVMDNEMDQIWGKLYETLSEATGKEYAGDISPEHQEQFDRLQEDMVDLFIQVSKINTIEPEIQCDDVERD